MQGGNPGTVHKLPAVVAFGGWYLFALAGPFSTTLADLGLVLVLLASVWVAASIWRDARDEPVFWMTLALLAYLVIHMSLFMPEYPEQMARQNPNWSHWFRVGGLWSIALGWWLFRFPSHFAPLITALVVGLLIGVVVEVDVERIASHGFADRSAWGYQPNYLGLASGAAFLALLSWALYGIHERRSPAVWIGIGLVLATLVALVLVSESRRAWLLLPLGLVALILFGLMFGNRDISLRRLLLGTALIAGTAALVIVVFREMIVERLGIEWEAIALLLTLEWGEVAGSRGVGARVAMWLAAAEAVAVEPWFGWGSGAGARVLRSDEFTDLVDHGHFHSLYVEILVSFGLIGFALFGITLLLILRASWRAARTGAISLPLAAGLAAVTVFVLAVMVISVRIGQTEGRALLTTLMAFHAYAMFRLSQWRASR